MTHPPALSTHEEVMPSSTGPRRTATTRTVVTLLLIVVAIGWFVGRSLMPVRQAVATLSDPPGHVAEGRAARSTVARDNGSDSLQMAVERVDRAFARLWQLEGLEPVPQADELTILRRMSLALHGTVPSLEEIRRFEAEPQPGRLQRWCDAMLADRRFAESFAERMTRAFVGTQGEPFLVFRRDRFKVWWAEQLAANRPYDEIVQDVIAERGLWTGQPATNFITHSVIDGTPAPATLAARTVRAVLGQRIDCAECHDHPFADWKQDDFRGLAAFYGQVKLSPFGVEDDPSRVFSAETGPGGQKRGVRAEVPFGEAWLPERGTAREKLAGWCTDPRNRRFARATVNRMWALLVGRPLSAGSPGHTDVDDLPDPPEPASDAERPPLDILADEFVASGYDLHRLLRLIAASRVFQLSSAVPVAAEAAVPHGAEAAVPFAAEAAVPHGAEAAVPVAAEAAVPFAAEAAVLAAAEAAEAMLPAAEPPAELVERLVDHWAIFPVERLRADQVVGGMLQASSVRTIDLNSALITRFIRFVREIDFLREYGDPGDAELLARSGTVPQALVRMNGKLVRETTEPNPFNATARLALASGSDEELIDNCFLACLTRRPTAKEKAFFLAAWSDDGSDSRTQRAEDLCWTLINAPEFSWNH